MNVKKYHLFLAALVYVAMTTLTACGGDDDDYSQTPQEEQSDNNDSFGVKAPNGVIAVDLGLPSGTKWANMNIGAEKSEDYGLFFAWGETVGYTSVGEGTPNSWGNYTMTDHCFDWAFYKWCSGSHNTLTKYCKNSSYGTVDNKTMLDIEDDAAHVNWGGQWMMPTYDEICELLANTINERATVNGVYGSKLTSKKNSNSIFLPATGFRDGSSLCGQSIDISYWSASVSQSDTNARNLFFDSGGAGSSNILRRFGLPVRPVLRK